jgi:membrane dipeptidase
MTLPIIDLHQDLLAHLQNLEQFPLGQQTSFEMLEKSNVKIVTATAFPMPKSEDQTDPICSELIEKDLNGYAEYAQKNPDWQIIRSARDVTNILETENRHGIIMHVEGLNLFDGSDWNQLERWYELGWRSLGPVWNLTNHLGGGANDPQTGLTDLGSQLISWLQNKRMIIDFAHMNKPTFWNSLELMHEPIMVSHANAQALCPSPRNLDDAQLKAIAKSGGVVGLFLANTFVVGRDRCGNITNAADHLDYMSRIMSRENLALGTDFGGIFSGLLNGLENITLITNLLNELSHRGWTNEHLENLAWKNAVRVLTQTLC